MNKKAKGLGKGLTALLGDKIPADGVTEIEIEKIIPNPHQPRRNFDTEALNELAASIAEFGIIQPLIICRNEDEYILVAGERRLRAAKLAGLTQVPAIIREYNDPDMAAIALIENLQREDLDPIEEATAYLRLREEFSLNQTEIAKQVGRSRPHIANTLRLLQFPEEIRDMLRERRVTAGQVRPLLAEKDAERQLLLARRIEREGASARRVEAWMNEKETPRPRKKEDGATEAYFNMLADQIKMELGTKVRIRRRAGEKLCGTIEIDFADATELERLAEYFK